MIPNPPRLEPGSRVTSVATGGRSFTALPDEAPSTPAGSSSRASQPPATRLGSTRLSARQGVNSSRSSKDGRNLVPTICFSLSSAALTSSGSTHSQTSQRKYDLLSTDQASSKTSDTIGKSPWIASQEVEAGASARSHRGARSPSPSSPVVADFGCDYNSSSGSSRTSRAQLDDLAGRSCPSSRGGSESLASKHVPAPT